MLLKQAPQSRLRLSPHSAEFAKVRSGFAGSSVVPCPGSADLRAATDHVGMLRCLKITRRAVEVLTMVREPPRSEEHTSELQSLMRISYAVFCLKKKNQIQ